MGNPQPLAVVHEEELEHDPKVPQQPALLPEDGGEMERAGELDSGQRVLHALGYRCRDGDVVGNAHHIVGWLDSIQAALGAHDNVPSA